MLEPPRRSGSNEYKQSMFWNRNEVGLKGVYISRTCFPGEKYIPYKEIIRLYNV